MKKIIYIMATVAAMLLAATQADAQLGKRYYINGGWQFNGTPGNDFAQSAQGYGAYMEGGYYVTPMLAVGGFASFNTNDEYVPRTTYTFSDQSALTTDLTRSIYQVPFGATVRYRFMRSMFQPYVEAKVGTEYSTQNTYMSTFVNRHDNWGLCGEALPKGANNQVKRCAATIIEKHGVEMLDRCVKKHFKTYNEVLQNG